ncbi:hypothetical protein EST38_g11473 [Candolleomyces aberdarensis]|uniref:Uncharacterized protein n=1 Tax=Candolleomyces aberdarensis TaxID=2316362 RepID=A0A4Q2D741_9AGAR|nr:hypothetical protein EST38_g11473 [Candolleomyces aberdarensis]
MAGSRKGKGREKKQIRFLNLLDPILKKIHWTFLGVDLWLSFPALFYPQFELLDSIELDDEEKDAKNENNEQEIFDEARLSPTDNELWNQLMAANPGLEDILNIMYKKNEQTLMALIAQLKVSACSAWSKDIKLMKEEAPDYVREFKANKLVDSFTATGSKTERGDFIQRIEDNGLKFKGTDWPAFLWSPGTKYNAKQRLKGMFRSFMVPRGLRTVYFGKMTMLNKNITSSRPPKAGIHSLKRIEAIHVAYVCVLIYFSLTNLISWRTKYFSFSLRRFYYNIIALLSSKKPWAEEILKYYGPP